MEVTVFDSIAKSALKTFDRYAYLFISLFTLSRLTYDGAV